MDPGRLLQRANCRTRWKVASNGCSGGMRRCAHTRVSLVSGPNIILLRTPITIPVGVGILTIDYRGVATKVERKAESNMARAADSELGFSITHILEEPAKRPFVRRSILGGVVRTGALLSLQSPRLPLHARHARRRARAVPGVRAMAGRPARSEGVARKGQVADRKTT